jgi:hypothetical protein
MKGNSKIVSLYESYIDKLEDIIYNHIAIKLATLRGFNESLQKEDKKIIESFPLMYFIVESLHVDNVLTVSKLTEINKNGKTFTTFINFTETNIEILKEKYPNLNHEIIIDNRLKLESIKEKIARIKKQRDSYYAHSDNEYFFEPNKIQKDFPDTFEDLEDITRVLQSIISVHRKIISGSMRVCMSSFIYLNAYKTIDLLKLGNEQWKNRN